MSQFFTGLFQVAGQLMSDPEVTRGVSGMIETLGQRAGDSQGQSGQSSQIGGGGADAGGGFGAILQSLGPMMQQLAVGASGQSQGAGKYIYRHCSCTHQACLLALPHYTSKQNVSQLCIALSCHFERPAGHIVIQLCMFSGTQQVAASATDGSSNWQDALSELDEAEQAEWERTIR